jgi:hypothetical protein
MKERKFPQSLQWAFSLLALSLVSNCAPPAPETQLFSENIRSGVNTATQQRDELECRVYASQQVPSAIYTSAPTVFNAPSTTNCSGNANILGNQVTGSSSCTSQGGATIIPGRTRDANSELRDRVYYQCLTDRSYRLVTQRGCSYSEIENFNSRVKSVEAYLSPKDYTKACYLNVLGRLNLYIPVD